MTQDQLYAERLSAAESRFKKKDFGWGEIASLGEWREVSDTLWEREVVFTGRRGPCPDHNRGYFAVWFYDGCACSFLHGLSGEPHEGSSANRKNRQRVLCPERKNRESVLAP